MPVIKDESIIAYVVADDLICRDCISPEEEEGLTLDDLLLNRQEDCRCFCDRCKREIAE